MCILRLRLLNHRSPHSFSEIDHWEDPVTRVLCVEKEELSEDSFFAQVSTLVPLISGPCLLLQDSEINKTYSDFGFYINHQYAYL